MCSFRIAASMLITCCAAIAVGAENSLIEEIIVTAQRFEENARKVPMSVSAFTDAMIEDRQIIGMSDLQIHVPNLTSTLENFGGARITIRGIGDLFGGEENRATTGPSVPIHINGVSAPVDVSVLEFYDVKRVEVMRGPQGSLYGRNATAGAINIVTHRPNFDGFSGYVDLEYGDYDHVRAQGAVNLAFGDQIAIRAAGMTLERDGYIENKAANEISGIDDDMDSRDFHAYRLTGEWRPTENLTVWLMYSRFVEDDSKVRIANQVCKQSELPNLGCDPNEFGLDAMHPSAVTGTVFAALAGTVPFGAKDPATGLIYEFPRPQLSLREQHTDFNPVFEFDEDAWILGVDWAIDPLTLSLSGSYFDTSRLSQQDYNMDVGFVMGPTLQNPSGLWPTSATSGGPGALRAGGACDLESFRAGVAGGCTLNRLNRAFAYDQAANNTEFWSAEFRVRSRLDGRFNFLLGANYVDIDVETDYYVILNTIDLVGFFGVPSIGFPQLYPSFFNSASEKQVESYSVFGELYVELNEQLKLTAGLRYNHDEDQQDVAGVLYDSLNVAPFFGGALTDPTWIRGPMVSFLGGMPDPTALALADYYGASGAIQAAAGLDELIAALQIVPAAPRLEEFNDLTGRLDKTDWDNVSGRIGLDWAASDDALIYAFYSQGYRPGGLHGPGSSRLRVEDVGTGDIDAGFGSERVHAFEIGAKTVWASGSLMLNGAAFFNQHDDLQMWQQGQVPGVGAFTQINNVDAQTMGFELEVVWRPTPWPGLRLELDYALLDTELKEGESIDPLNRTQGDSNLVNLKNFNPDSGIGDGFVAPIAGVLPLVGSAIASGAAVAALGEYDNGIPVYFNRSFLDAAGVSTANAIPADLKGNELPNSPRHSVRLGAAHTWTLRSGAFTLRYDYYWQDSSYGREFNTPGDEIDGWGQHNASAIIEGSGGRWRARVWIRNITNEVVVTGHWVAPDVSGNFRNYFMGEPRIFGASLRYNFGVL